MISVETRSSLITAPTRPKSTSAASWLLSRRLTLLQTRELRVGKRYGARRIVGAAFSGWSLPPEIFLFAYVGCRRFADVVFGRGAVELSADPLELIAAHTGVAVVVCRL